MHGGWKVTKAQIKKAIVAIGVIFSAINLGSAAFAAGDDFVSRYDSSPTITCMSFGVKLVEAKEVEEQTVVTNALSEESCSGEAITGPEHQGSRIAISAKESCSNKCERCKDPMCN